MPPSADKVVVSDCWPLIALRRLDLLALLPALFAQVQVPQQVLDECLARPANADAVRIQAALAQGWLTPCTATPIARPGLDLCERAAIARALEISAGLLADDLGARQHAAALGLTVIGTLGVLVLAKRAGLAYSELIDELGRRGIATIRLQPGELEHELASFGR